MDGVDVARGHLLRPQKSQSHLPDASGDTDFVNRGYAFRMWMSTVRFMLGLFGWFVQWQSRSGSLVGAVSQCLSHFCSLLPDSFTLPLDESMPPIPVENRMVQRGYVLGVIGCLECGERWKRLGVATPKLEHELLVPVHIVVLLVLRGE